MSHKIESSYLGELRVSSTHLASNIEIITDPNINPSKKDMTTILNYEMIVNKINFLVNKKHHDLLEELAENIFDVIFKFRLVKKVKIKIEKLEIIKETESVGINVSKTRV